MAAVKLALGRVQTGGFLEDQMQKQGRDAARMANDLETRIAALEWRQGIGRTLVPMADANTTATTAQAAGQFVVCTGANTAVRILTLPIATDATAYSRWIVNITTGGFAVTVRMPTGATVSVANGTIKGVVVAAAGCSLLT